jgi:hypothetical protein
LKGLKNFYNPHHCFRNKKASRKISVMAGVILMSIMVILSSCSRRLVTSGQSALLPSAYTHSGKYIKYKSIAKSRSGIRRYNLDCHIPSAAK